MIACLTVPYFAAAVEQRDDAALAGPGLVIGGRPWEPQPVYAFSREVAKRGVRPGMSLRLANVLSPGSRFMPANPPRYLSTSGEIVDVLTDFTHLVEPEELWLPAHDPPHQEKAGGQDQPKLGTAFGRSLPAYYTLDLESLPLAEALPLSQEMGRVVRQHTRLAPAVGLAESRFAAQVAAALTRPNHARPISPGEEAQFLASRTIHFLPLHKENARRLSLLGIRTLGQLTALPLASLQAQLSDQTLSGGLRGSQFAHFYRLAQGHLGQESKGDELLFSVRPLATEKHEQVTFRFEEPVANMLTLERVLARIATELAGRLLAAKQEGGTLRLAWEVAPNDSLPDDDGRHRHASGSNVRSSNMRGLNLSLSRRRPTADPQRLTDSLHELLHQAVGFEGLKFEPLISEQGGFRQGVISLTVTLTDLTPVTAWQPSLFSDLDSKLSGVTGQAQEVLERITTKHGRGNIYRPELTDKGHPLPERRFQLRELAPV